MAHRFFKSTLAFFFALTPYQVNADANLANKEAADKIMSLLKSNETIGQLMKASKMRQDYLGFLQTKISKVENSPLPKFVRQNDTTFSLQADSNQVAFEIKEATTGLFLINNKRVNASIEHSAESIWGKVSDSLPKSSARNALDWIFPEARAFTLIGLALVGTIVLAVANIAYTSACMYLQNADTQCTRHLAHLERLPVQNPASNHEVGPKEIEATRKAVSELIQAKESLSATFVNKGCPATKKELTTCLTELVNRGKATLGDINLMPNQNAAKPSVVNSNQ